jgi:hypothetical protein
MAGGDFDNDGRPDVAVASSLDNNITIRLGAGDGTLLAATTYATGKTPDAIVAADLNRDGVLDLVTINEMSDDLSILIGDGRGGFGAPSSVPLSAPIGTGGLASGDFNRDGIIDLAVCTGAGSHVLLGQPGGGFVASGDYALQSAITAGDVNSDGILDLVGTLNYQLDTLLGKGDGTFIDVGQSYLAPGGNMLALGDYNGDAKLDVVATTGEAVAVLLGRGDGTFTQVAAVAMTNFGGAVLPVDLNGDGKLDLLTAVDYEAADSMFAGIHVFFGNGDGSLQNPIRYVTPSDARASVAADFNGDGVIDLATSCIYQDISLWRGR